MRLERQPEGNKECKVNDDLSERIGLLTRREVEARILSPVIAALARELGEDRVMDVLRATVAEIAAKQGEALAASAGGNSLAHFARTLELWQRDGALEIEITEQTETTLSFNVTRCRYAELYSSLGIGGLGEIPSYARDFAFAKGFDPRLKLRRSGTIMGGSPTCDFRYTVDRTGV
jgi:hypothetical protein